MATKERSKPPLTPARRVRLSLLSGFIFAIILGAVIYSLPEKNLQSNEAPLPQTASMNKAPLVRYAGKSGIDALTLLKQDALVKQDNSGLVTSINGLKADANKREYWSFFINGKMAEVGPLTYSTQDGDILEWKIQTY